MSIKIYLKFVLNGWIDKKSALVQVMVGTKQGDKALPEPTRTTRMPAFWGYPHWPIITHTIEQFILDPKSKQDKVKVTNLKNLPKLQIF